jgi:hypothetical protein
LKRSDGADAFHKPFNALFEGVRCRDFVVQDEAVAVVESSSVHEAAELIAQEQVLNSAAVPQACIARYRNEDNHPSVGFNGNPLTPESHASKGNPKKFSTEDLNADRPHNALLQVMLKHQSRLPCVMLKHNLHPDKEQLIDRNS